MGLEGNEEEILRNRKEAKISAMVQGIAGAASTALKSFEEGKMSRQHAEEFIINNAKVHLDELAKTRKYPEII